MPDENDDYFINALALTLKTKGVSQAGLFYHVIGTRASGDAQTSIGNGLLNYFVTWNALGMYPHLENEAGRYRAWQSVHEGDDGIIAFHPQLLSTLNNGLLMSQVMGFSLKVDIYDDIDKTSFCGMFLFAHAGRVYSYSDPYRTLAKIHTIIAEGNNRSLAVAKTLSLLFLNPNVPIISSYCKLVIRTIAPTLTATGISITRALSNIRSQEKNLTARNFLQYARTTTGISLKNAKRVSKVDVRRDNHRVLATVQAFLAHVRPPPCDTQFAERTGLSLRALKEYDAYLDQLTYLPAELPELPFLNLVIDDSTSQLYINRDQIRYG